jgi:hypothetical protein
MPMLKAAATSMNRSGGDGDGERSENTNGRETDTATETVIGNGAQDLMAVTGAEIVSVIRCLLMRPRGARGGKSSQDPKLDV